MAEEVQLSAREEGHEPTDPLMKRRYDKLREAWLGARAEGVRLRQESSEYYEGEPQRALSDFDARVFQQADVKGMLLLDQYALPRQDGPVVACMQRWCQSPEFRARGHAVFFLLPAGLPEGLAPLLGIEYAENVQRVEVGAHTARELRSFLMHWYVTRGSLPVPLADLDYCAGALAAYGRGRRDFGLGLLVSYLSSPAAWRSLSDAAGLVRPQLDATGLLRYLKSQIIGQDAVIERAVSVIERAYRRPPARAPIATFLCVGPPGVGKSELARALARYFYPGDESKLLKINLGDFKDQAAVNRLIGPPPGYVGFRTDRNGQPAPGGQLTAPMIQDRQRVVLLDEVEKAHAQVLDAFLPVFEVGQLADASTGDWADFSRAIIVVTSNYEAQAFSRMLEENPDADIKSLDRLSRRILTSGPQPFRPELLRRDVTILPYRQLRDDDMAGIARLNIDSIAEKEGTRVADVDPEVLEHLVRRNRGLGTVSDLRRIIDEDLSDQLAEYSGATVRVVLENGSPRVVAA